jgi:hypothetical protein
VYLECNYRSMPGRRGLRRRRPIFHCHGIYVPLATNRMQFSTKASIDVGMGMGIGIAVARKDGEAPDEPLGKANHVLYLRRGEGRGSFAFLSCRATNEKSDLGYPPTDAAMGGFRRRVT